MKKILFQILIQCIFTISASAQSSQCVSPSSLKPTVSAMLLLQSYQNLVQNDHVKICDPALNFKSVSLAMPAQDFGGLDHGGIVTFVSYYRNDQDSNAFYTIWGKDSIEFTSYGVCPPHPIIFHLPDVERN